MSMATVIYKSAAQAKSPAQVIHCNCSTVVWYFVTDVFLSSVHKEVFRQCESPQRQSGCVFKHPTLHLSTPNLHVLPPDTEHIHSFLLSLAVRQLQPIFVKILQHVYSCHGHENCQCASLIPGSRSRQSWPPLERCHVELQCQQC